MNSIVNDIRAFYDFLQLLGNKSDEYLYSISYRFSMINMIYLYDKAVLRFYSSALAIFFDLCYNILSIYRLEDIYAT